MILREISDTAKYADVAGYVKEGYIDMTEDKSLDRITPRIYETDTAFEPDHIDVYVNGIRVEQGDNKDYIVISDKRIEFYYDLDVDDIVRAKYIKK